MKQRVNILMSALLLFVFVFATFVTVQADNPNNCTEVGCQPYDCCFNDNSDIGCQNTYGIWLQGVCHCDWTGANPNECLITSCQYGCS